MKPKFKGTPGPWKICRLGMTIERRYIRTLPLLKCKTHHGYRDIAKSLGTSTTTPIC